MFQSRYIGFEMKQLNGSILKHLLTPSNLSETGMAGGLWDWAQWSRRPQSTEPNWIQTNLATARYAKPAGLIESGISNKFLSNMVYLSPDYREPVQLMFQYYQLAPSPVGLAFFLLERNLRECKRDFQIGLSSLVLSLNNKKYAIESQESWCSKKMISRLNWPKRI